MSGPQLVITAADVQQAFPRATDVSANGFRLGGWARISFTLARANYELRADHRLNQVECGYAGTQTALVVAVPEDWRACIKAAVAITRADLVASVEKSQATIAELDEVMQEVL